MVSTLLADPDPRRATPAHLTWPQIRVSRPPRLDPPFEDEGDGPPVPTQHQADEECAAGITSDAPASGSIGLAAPTSSRAALAYVRLCIEVLNGYRPPSHLRRLGGPVEFVDVVAQIRRRHNARGRFGSTTPARMPSTPTSGAARPPRRNVSAALPPLGREHRNSGAWAPVSLTRLRVSEPLDGVAEVVAVLSQAGFAMAMAIRLERRAGAWTCALAQVV